MNNRWSTITVRDLVKKKEAEIKTGPFGTQLHASDYVANGTPVINARNIGFGDIRNEKLEFISDDTVKRLSSHLLRANDIVFGRKGSVERHSFIKDQHINWFQGTDCLRLRISSTNLLPRFVSYYLLTDHHKQWIVNQSSHGATMTSLNQDIISRIEFPIPPIEEQEKIVKILSAYDDLIENNTRRIQILEEMAQTIYREWFVKFRFPGNEGTKLIASEIGEIPAGWEVIRLGDISNITMGQSPESKYYNLNGAGLPFHQGVTDFGGRFPKDRVFCTIDNRVAEKGDILCSVRAPVGRLNIANKKIVLGRGLCSIRSKYNAQVFLFYQLKEIFKEEDSMGGGTIFKAVTKEDIRSIKFLVPETRLVNEFEEISRPISALLENLYKKNDNLRQQRDLLLPRLINGEIELEDMEGTTID